MIAESVWNGTHAALAVACRSARHAGSWRTRTRKRKMQTRELPKYLYIEKVRPKTREAIRGKRLRVFN